MKARGPDDLPPLIFKTFCNILASPITYIFNRSLKDGVFPDILKSANVVPVFKSGDRSLVSNYRPISLLCTLAKVFEKCVYDDIYHQVKPLITDNQHGFLSQRSCCTNLAVYTQYLANSINDRKQVDVVFTDLSKAFDKVDHYLLIQKLKSYGFHGSILNWMSSYLLNRLQRVVWQDFFSPWCEVTSGVPQGSLLGPLLFTIYINDLPDVLRFSRVVLYADDMKVFRQIDSVDDCELLQRDLDAVSAWFSEWRLQLNIGKCESITFSNKRRHVVDFPYRITSTPLRRVSEVKDLGITFRSDLTFSSHILKITSRANRLLGFVKRKTREFSDMSAIKCLYVALVRPLLEYSSVVWTPYQSKYINILEKVQHRFLKYLGYRSRLPGTMTYTELCEHFSLPSLRKRRVITDLVFLHRCLSGATYAPEILRNINFLVPRMSSRSKATFYVRKQRIDIAKHHNPVNRICSCFNNLSDSQVQVDIFSNSLSCFRRSLFENLSV